MQIIWCDNFHQYINIFRPNSNITYPVLEHVIHLHGFFSRSLRKIQKSLKLEHNIEISHQTIENIRLFSDFQLQFKISLFQNITSLMHCELENKVNDGMFFSYSPLKLIIWWQDL